MDPSTTGQTDQASRRPCRPWAWLRTRLSRSRAVPEPSRSRRILFLDDDALRAAAFMQDHPEAIWVTTVADCLARLEEEWDEVHLDHDLGGKTFVDSSAEDCGMEVIRWLCKEPRHHLKQTLFFIHTHNAAAGLLMVLQMRGGGYQAEFRPFGLDLDRLLARDES